MLFNKLKIDSAGLKKTKTGISTAASELEKLRGKHKIVDMMFEYRELTKLSSTYVDALPKLLKPDGRVHTSFNQTIAQTGRLSSTNPNLQNIPVRTETGKEIRKAFIAGKDKVLVSADYSQIELRLAAALADDKPMIAFGCWKRGIKETRVVKSGINLTPQQRAEIDKKIEADRRRHQCHPRASCAPS